MYFLLIKNETNPQAAKNKNKKAGFYPGKAFFMIGNSNMTNEHEVHEAPVASDKILGWETSGK